MGSVEPTRMLCSATSHLLNHAFYENAEWLKVSYIRFHGITSEKLHKSLEKTELTTNDNYTTIKVRSGFGIRL